MLKLSGVNAFVAKSKAQQALVKRKATDFVKDKAKEVLKTLVLNAPQWSGTAASSWEISLSGDTPGAYVVRDINNKSFSGDPKFRGDTEAWERALRNNALQFNKIRWNSKISITNNDSVAEALASGEIQASELRWGNYLSPNDVMAITYTVTKFRYLGKSL